MIILLSIGASDAALATLMMTVTIFLQLSGINHFVTAIVDKMKGKDIAWIHFHYSKHPHWFTGANTYRLGHFMYLLT